MFSKVYLFGQKVKSYITCIIWGLSKITEFGLTLEKNLQVLTRASSSSAAGLTSNEEVESMENMVCDALGVNMSYDEPQYDNNNELPNEESQRFYNLFIETNKQFFEGLIATVKIIDVCAAFSSQVDEEYF